MPQVHTPAQTSQSTPKVSPSLLNRPAHSPHTDLLPTNLASEEPTPREFVAVAPAPHRFPHLLLPRRPADLYMHDWVQAQAAAMPNLTYVPVVSDALPEDNWTGRTGFVHAAVLQDHANLSGHQVYACGAPIVVDSARAAYTQAGLPSDEFYADSFTSAADKA